MGPGIVGIVASTVLILGVAANALGQPFTLDEKIKPAELKLEPYGAAGDKTAGRMYGAVITQTQSTQYLFVRNVSIFSPDYVGVSTGDPSAPVTVSVHKDTWDHADRKGQTDPAGVWQTTFKTNGDFGVRVDADRLPATYAVVVWVGNEVTAPVPSPFTRASGSGPTTAGPALFQSRAGWLVALALLVILGIVIYKSRRARMVLLIGTIAASPFLSRTASAAGGKMPSVADLLKQLKQILDIQQNTEKFWDTLEKLSQDEALPDESQRGPALPSSCIDQSWSISAEDQSRAQGCQCMATAVDKLRKNRQMLEKLRIIVTNQKAFVDKAIALGNSYSQLHTLLGLQWVGIRKHDIEEPYAQFKQISNQKHQAVMAAVEKDLKDIGRCEAQLGEPDWYTKYGYIYYEFLYSAYKPSF